MSEVAASLPAPEPRRIGKDGLVQQAIVHHVLPVS